MEKKTTFTYPLNAAQQEALAELLRTGNYRPTHVEHARIAVTTPDFNVTLYKSGKCVVQGRGAADFVLF